MSSASAARAPRSVQDIVDALRDAGLLVSVPASLPETIIDVVDDSRTVRPGSAFLAVKGHLQDGHDWIAAAIRSGATVVFGDDAARMADATTAVPCVVVRDGRRAAAVAAAAFHAWPARDLVLVGVTGTNGKTTTVGLLRHLLHRHDLPAASIGTLGVLVGASEHPWAGSSGLTTPGPVELQRVLRQLRDLGVRSVAMEVSSHSLDQRRAEGLSFSAVVFTNLTRDHLDYHGTMEAYRAAKLRLVGLLTRDGTAIWNADDPAWREVPSAPRTLTFGVDTPADVTARNVTYEPQGSRFLLVAPDGAVTVHLPLIGDFNVANALAAASTALALGHSLADVAERLSSSPQVPGRLERIAESPTVLRDYAHTPDALDRALRAVQPFARGVHDAPARHDVARDDDARDDDAHDVGEREADTRGRLIVVFGCGGDRDRGKRAEMGRIAESLANVVVVTSDNPRTEDPERILDDIEAGMVSDGHQRIEDRRAAIAWALHEATEHDVVVLAGKGHETYQLRGTESFPFDERQIVQDLLLTPRA